MKRRLWGMAEVKTRPQTCSQCGANLAVTDETKDGRKEPWRHISGANYFCDLECLSAWAGHKP